MRRPPHLPDPPSLTAGQIHYLPPTATAPPGLADHPILLLSAPTATQLIPVCLITTLKGTSLATKHPGPGAHARRARYLSLRAPHPDTGAALACTVSGRALERQSYVRVSDMFWARASEVQALARGSARVPLDAMAAVWEGVQRYCGAEEWARVQAARAAGKTAAVPELPPVSWTAPAPPPRPVATVPRAAYVPTATESTPLSHSGHTSYSHRSGHSYDYSPHVEARATAGPSPWHVLAVATLRVFFMLLAAAAVGAVGYGVWAGVAALGHWVAHGGILGALKAAVGALWEAVRWVALGLWHLVSWVVLPLWHMVKALAVGLWKGVAGG